MTAQEFISNMQRTVAAKYGWINTYDGGLSDRDSACLRAAIVNIAKERGVTADMICEAYPNEGTFTYTDGVVDYVLGALNPMTQMVIDMTKMGVVAVAF